MESCLFNSSKYCVIGNFVLSYSGTCNSSHRRSKTYYMHRCVFGPRWFIWGMPNCCVEWRTSDKIRYKGTARFKLLKTLAVVSVMAEFRKEIENSSVVLFNDNNTTLISLLKGCCKNPEANKLAWTFWKLVGAANCTIWIERVNSAANPAYRLSHQVTTIGHSDAFQ